MANSVDPDQTAPEREQSNQGLHCLQDSVYHPASVVKTFVKKSFVNNVCCNFLLSQ